MRAKAMLASLVLAISLLSSTSVGAASEEQRCLALNIYAESRNTSVADETAVGFVTINRVISQEYPDTICGVVYQHDQFSWTRHPLKIVDDKAFKDAQTIASLIISDQVPDVSRGAIAFHERRVHPAWSRKMDVAFETKVHVYYKKRDKI